VNGRRPAGNRPSRLLVARRTLLLLAASVPLAACRTGSGSTGDAAIPSAPAASPAAPERSSTIGAPLGPITVFAASSLTDAFREIGVGMRAAMPGASVAFNFGGSPTLRTQLAQGARADVFASADEATMLGAQEDGTIIGPPRIFALNLLTVIMPAGNPARITQVQDLARPGLKLVLAAPDVPVGLYARQAFAAMGRDAPFGSGFAAAVARNVVSNETDVKAVVAKVQLGEADAGVVYRTDVTAAVRAKVTELAIPDADNVVARYPIALVKGGPNPAGGQAFLSYVLSPRGQEVLARYGFGSAPGV
jgi:molybdate transport system substrate-binding protein